MLDLGAVKGQRTWQGRTAPVRRLPRL